MLQVIDTKNAEHNSLDWHQIWRDSPEYLEMKKELQRVRALGSEQLPNPTAPLDGDPSQHQEFVSSFATQFWEVNVRTFKHFWRLPDYIYSKTIMCVLYVRQTSAQSYRSSLVSNV